jgi:hypothetical protein
MHDLNLVIPLIPGLVAAYFTYRLGIKKSDREERLEQINYWKERAENADRTRIEAESENAELRRELKEYSQKYNKDKGDN